MNSLLRLASDIANRAFEPKAIAVTYYAQVPNVGDLLNPYLIPKLSGKAIYRAQTSALPHLRAIGSVIGSASPRSYIWGSGSIDGKTPAKDIDPAKIYALRGKKTWDLLHSASRLDARVPLGDPAVLMPDFYDPTIAKGHRCGLIPHFSDLDHARDLAKHLQELHIIDVRQQPEAFINEMKSCQFIMSSSLHGLILADSYGIPNVWVKMSDKLLGGEWKFLDYYSTTDSSNASPTFIDSAQTLREASSGIADRAVANSYVESKDRLYDAFERVCRNF